MPMYDFECPSCGHVDKDRIVKASTIVVCGQAIRGVAGNVFTCGFEMEKVQATPSFTFGKGRSAESHMDFQARERAKLQARSDAHDASPAGQESRAERMDFAAKNYTK